MQAAPYLMNVLDVLFVFIGQLWTSEPIGKARKKYSVFIAS